MAVCDRSYLCIWDRVRERRERKRSEMWSKQRDHEREHERSTNNQQEGEKVSRTIRKKSVSRERGKRDRVRSHSAALH